MSHGYKDFSWIKVRNLTVNQEIYNGDEVQTVLEIEHKGKTAELVVSDGPDKTKTLEFRLSAELLVR